MTDSEPRATNVTSSLTGVTPVNIAGHTTTLSVEPEEHAEDRKLRLHKERVLFWFCLVAVTGSLLACGYLISTHAQLSRG